MVALLADDPLGAERETPSDPPAACYLDAFDAITNNANVLLAVAEMEGEVVGCLQLDLLPGLSWRGAWRGQLESVAVARRLRGRGIGAAMIRWALAHCRERGCALVQLTSHKSRTRAHRFYARLGFEASHEGMKCVL
ncbi:MAG: GNAT family N-acetyltransferase [Alphaproteobacteria bacterium]